MAAKAIMPAVKPKNAIMGIMVTIASSVVFKAVFFSSAFLAAIICDNDDIFDGIRIQHHRRRPAGRD